MTNDEYYAALDEEHQRQYESALQKHPDCTDPDHPGCEECEPSND